MIKIQVNRDYRNIPIQVDAEINTPNQIDVVTEIFRELAKIVDEYYVIRELKFQRKLRKMRYEQVTKPEQAMMCVKFMFEKVS